jgi:hypothetical protein
VAGDLRSLADRYVRLSTELEETRDEMRRVLANGADPGANPTRPAGSSGGKRQARTRAASQAKQRPIEIKAAAIEDDILTLLKSRPMKVSEIAKATASKSSTTAERLLRLQRRGQVERGESGEWAAMATG